MKNFLCVLLAGHKEILVVCSFRCLFDYYKFAHTDAILADLEKTLSDMSRLKI